MPALGSEGVAELEGLMAQMDHYMRHQDLTGYSRAHHRFHARLLSGAGERLTKLIAELFDHAERYRIVFGVATSETWGKRQSEHRGIVDAAAQRDPDLTVLRLVQHYGYAAAMIFKSLGGDYTPNQLRIASATVAPGSERSLD